MVYSALIPGCWSERGLGRNVGRNGVAQAYWTYDQWMFRKSFELIRCLGVLSETALESDADYQHQSGAVGAAGGRGSASPARSIKEYKFLRIPLAAL